MIYRRPHLLLQAAPPSLALEHFFKSVRRHKLDRGVSPWQGVVNEIQIYGSVLSVEELVSVMAEKSYPRLLFKGNYIGGAFQHDLEFSENGMEEYAGEGGLTIKVNGGSTM